MTDKLSAIEVAELAWAEHERNGFCMSKDGKRRLRAAILAYLSAIAEDEASVEAARRAIESHPAYDCGSTGDEEMARAVLRTLLERAKEQKP